MARLRVHFLVTGKGNPASSTKTTLQDVLPTIHIQEASPPPSPTISCPALPPSTPYLLRRCLAEPIFDFNVSVHPLDNPSIRNMKLQEELNEPATEPPIRSITLESRHLPWPITISTEHYYLTVFDLLMGIYNNLRIVATEEDFAKQSRERQDEIALAFYDRWERRAPSNFREQERCKGLRRVDFLPGSTLHFRRLEKAKGSDTWIIQFRQ
jgi:hypothetical protein